MHGTEMPPISRASVAASFDDEKEKAATYRYSHCCASRATTERPATLKKTTAERDAAPGTKIEE